MYNAFLTITLMTFYLGYVLICLYVYSISAVVKVVMWSRGLTWRSQVGANPIPIPHPTNLALFGHKITLYIFNQGAHTVAGAQIGAGGWAPWPLHFNRCLSVVHCHVCFSSLLWAVLPELNWSIDWLTDWRTDWLTDSLIDWWEVRARDLVPVQLAVLVLLLALFLERDDDEADEDVDHEEGDDDDVDNVERRHFQPVVVHLAHALAVRVDTRVHQSKDKGFCFYFCRVHRRQHSSYRLLMLRVRSWNTEAGASWAIVGYAQRV